MSTSSGRRVWGPGRAEPDRALLIHCVLSATWHLILKERKYECKILLLWDNKLDVPGYLSVQISQLQPGGDSPFPFWNILVKY